MTNRVGDTHYFHIARFSALLLLHSIVKLLEHDKTTATQQSECKINERNDVIYENKMRIFRFIYEKSGTHVKNFLKSFV